ncbi:unnamed protein product [Boreogadus saida]
MCTFRIRPSASFATLHYTFARATLPPLTPVAAPSPLERHDLQSEAVCDKPPGITLLHSKVNGINGDDEEIIPPTKEMLQQHMHHLHRV